MSPQNSTLGLIGGNFESTSFRSRFRSGIYRLEDTAYIRNYAENIDNFYYTGTKFSYPDTTSDPSYLSGIWIRPDLSAMHYCSGSISDTPGSVSTENMIGFNYFQSALGDISNLSTSTSSRYIPWVTGTSSSSISWYPEATGLSYKSDGSKVILCGNLVSVVNGSTTTRGPIIFQYSFDSPYSFADMNGSSVFTYSGTNYNVYLATIGTQFFYAPEKSYKFGTSSTDKIDDIFVHPDGLVFYYLRNNVLYQGSISSAWDIGTEGSNLNVNTGSLTINPNLVSELSLTGRFSGISFNYTGTKLYLISKLYGGTIFQYNLSTPWDITTSYFKTFLYVGQFENEIEGTSNGIIMFPDGETVICAGLNGFVGSLYEYKILPY